MRKIAIVLSVVLSAIILLSTPAYALTASTSPSLPDQKLEGATVDFSLTITDIKGNCIIIETDLDKDGNTPIFDITGLTGYQLTIHEKDIEICNNLPSSLTLSIHGRIPKGITTQDVQVQGGKILKLKFFDLGQHIYYRVKDVMDGSVLSSDAKTFTIIHPQLEDARKKIEENIKDPDARRIAEQYIDLGLFDYVYNDLLPLFSKYDPENISRLQNRINELEALVAQLNQTIKKQGQIIQEQNATISQQEGKISQLKGENANLKNENSNLKSQIASLNSQISEKDKKISEMDEARMEYAHKAKNMQIAAVVLFILMLVVGFVGYSTGKKAGYSTGFREGKEKGYSQGYRKGKEDGYQQGLDECQGIKIE
ncbi:hypothetical protein [Thermococcus sp.]